jgi:hypothetical protein
MEMVSQSGQKSHEIGQQTSADTAGQRTGKPGKKACRQTLVVLQDKSPVMGFFG